MDTVLTPFYFRGDDLWLAQDPFNSVPDGLFETICADIPAERMVCLIPISITPVVALVFHRVLPSGHHIAAMSTPEAPIAEEVFILAVPATVLGIMLESCLSGLKCLLVDNCWDGNRNPLFFGLSTPSRLSIRIVGAGLAFPLPIVQGANIGLIGQHIVQC